MRVAKWAVALWTPSSSGNRFPAKPGGRCSHWCWWPPWSDSWLCRCLVSRIVGVYPFVYFVWRKRSIYLGVAVHVLLNGISTTLTIIAVAATLA